MNKATIDPWTISQKMIDALNDQAMQEARFGNTALMNSMGQQAERQNLGIRNEYDVAAAGDRYERAKNLDVLGSHLRIREEQFKSAGGSRRPGFGGGMKTAADQAYQYYRQKGLSHAHAAGIAANLAVESGGDPNVYSGQRRGDAGSAGYAAQWRGVRLQNLERFAQSRGHQQPTLEDQYDFVLEEGNPGSPFFEAGAGRAHQLSAAAPSADAAATSFMQHFERPNADPNINHVATRQQIAAGIPDTGAQPDATTTAGVQQHTVPTGAPASDTMFPTQQRRYTGPVTGDPEIDALAPELDESTFDPNRDTGGYSMTPEEVDALIDPTTRKMIPPGKIAVDIGTYSGDQLPLALQNVEAAGNLIPLYGTDPNSGKSQYLILADDPNYMPSPEGMPSQTGPVPYDPNTRQTITAPDPNITPPPPAAQTPFDPASLTRRYRPENRNLDLGPGRDGDSKYINGVEYIFNAGKWIPTE